MSYYSCQLNVEGRGERLTGINLSGARDVKCAKVISNKIGEDVHHSLTLEPCLISRSRKPCLFKVCGGPDTAAVDQRSSRIRTTDSEMFMVDASSSILERKRKRIRVTQSQSASTNTNSRRERMIEQQRRGLLDVEIGRIRERYYEQEKVLEKEVEKLEKMYEMAMERLEEEEKEEEEEEEEDVDNSVAGLWEVQSTYPETEPDPDNPDNIELEALRPEGEHRQQGLGQPLRARRKLVLCR